MKALITSIALILSLSSNAQSAGRLIEQAGSKRSTAIITGVAGMALAGMMIAVDKDNTMPAVGIGAMCLGVSFTLNYGAARKERRAGRIMQGLK